MIPSDETTVRLRRTVALPPDRTWLAITDVPTAAAAMPNCESVVGDDGRRFESEGGENPVATLLAADAAARRERTFDPDARYAARLAVGVDRFSLGFEAAVTVCERDCPRIVARGEGEDAGNAVEALGTVEIGDGDGANGDGEFVDETPVTWVAEVSVSGPVAALGASALEPAVRRAADAYFDRLNALVADATD